MILKLKGNCVKCGGEIFEEYPPLEDTRVIREAPVFHWNGLPYYSDYIGEEKPNGECKIMMDDMPKIKSPFVREKINGNYVVTPKIEEGYEWVFEDPNVMAVEKLDGTNVSIFMSDGNIVGLNNRTNAVDFNTFSKNRFIDGVRSAYAKGRVPLDNGQHFGELMGPKIQKNFLGIDEPFWFSFNFLQKKFSYSSFHRYPKTFENISEWFKDDLFSLVYCYVHSGEKVQPEGIVFTHPDGRMAKLRRDMFDWFKGRRHKE